MIGSPPPKNGSPVSGSSGNSGIIFGSEDGSSASEGKNGGGVVTPGKMFPSGSDPPSGGAGGSHSGIPPTKITWVGGASV